MYFLLVSLIYLTFAQISVKTVSEQGFFIQFDHVSSLDRVYWVAHTAKEALSIKELMNGVSSSNLGLGCSGQVTKRQLMKRPQFEVQCQLDFGTQYTLEALVVKDDNYEILTSDFTLDLKNSRGSQRRLLSIEGTGEASDTTYVPSGTGEASDTTSVPSTSNAPSSTGQVSDTTNVPNNDGNLSLPTAAPTTVEATIPITSTSLPKEEDDGSKFAGFDLSSGGGISLFVFAILLILAVLALIIGGPSLYRRYYTTFGAKTVEASPKAAAKLSEMNKRSADLSKSKLGGSSFQSESKIEIAPIKSEDKIALMDPVE